jgi:hypothetical protein
MALAASKNRHGFKPPLLWTVIKQLRPEFVSFPIGTDSAVVCHWQPRVLENQKRVLLGQVFVIGRIPSWSEACLARHHPRLLASLQQDCRLMY